MPLKKSQAALEFIMTYGWAILAVIIAIAALSYFGVLKPDRVMQMLIILRFKKRIKIRFFLPIHTANMK